MRKRILLASASAGTGHVRAAEAIGMALRAGEPSVHVEHVDVLRLAPSWVGAAYRDGFEMLAARAPGVWREIYHLTDGPGVDSARWSALAQKLLFGPFERVVRGGGWDVVICTHFLPAQLMAGRAGAPPFAIVVTDFSLHRYWAQPGVGRYHVATEALAAELRGRIRGARVEVTGIPVRPDLLDVPARAAAAAALGLDRTRPTVVVMGGGLGLGVKPLAHAAACADVQVVALCGRSRHALDSLASAPNVRAVDYVDDVRPYLAAADVLVTKPGGLSTSEALALGLPMILANPIPGHEEANRCYLVDAGAAIAADIAAEVTRATRFLTESPDRLAAMRRACLRLGRADAALAVAHATRRDLLLEEAA